jgi:hypothetical protein
MICYQELDKHDIVKKLKPLWKRGGWWWDIETKRITATVGFDWDSEWVTIRRVRGFRCKLYHDLVFKIMDVFPTYCLGCWKVVARPDTFEDFINCMPVMRKLDLPSKLGVVPRENTFGLYQCYFYQDSLEEAKEVEALVRKEFPQGVNIFTKRFCTEFEQKFGSSDTLEPTAEMYEITAQIEELIDFPDAWGLQPDLLVEHIMKGWILKASQAGDKTAKKYMEQPITAQCVHY